MTSLPAQPTTSALLSCLLLPTLNCAATLEPLTIPRKRPAAETRIRVVYRPCITIISLQPLRPLFKGLRPLNKYVTVEALNAPGVRSSPDHQSNDALFDCLIFRCIGGPEG